MKVYINREPVTGPWGGGNKTVTKLFERLSEQHEVVFNLCPDIDLIFCIDPRPNNYGEWYQHFLNYRGQFQKTKIIQRVGDLGTHSKPQLTEMVKQAVLYSDFIIFPSKWAKEWLGYSKDNYRIVYNCPLEIFYENRSNNMEIDGKIKLVSHHWSTNPKKGFDMYKKLDEFVGENDKFEFTYIGRKPDDLILKNSTYISPIDAEQLSKILPRNDIYITASIEEAGANHVLESLAAGLPVVYHKDGGSILDYCEDYGEQYSNFEEMVSSIEKVADNYKLYKEKVLCYNDKIDNVIEKYMEVINELQS
jgi:glycosyltransferase involved in cell wall biosynthesis